MGHRHRALLGTRSFFAEEWVLHNGAKKWPRKFGECGNESFVTIGICMKEAFTCRVGVKAAEDSEFPICAGNVSVPWTGSPQLDEDLIRDLIGPQAQRTLGKSTDHAGVETIQKRGVRSSWWTVICDGRK